VDFAGEQEFAGRFGTRGSSSLRRFEVADEQELEAFAVEAVGADDEMLGGF
jgi:hypothetical protein